LFAFPVSQNYLLGNAFAGVALPREQARSLGRREPLPSINGDALEERLDEFSGDRLGRRRASDPVAVRDRLRLAEMADAHCGDLQQVDYRLPNGTDESGWMLSVVGKGDRVRQVPVPARLVQELRDELDQNGLEADVRHESNHDVGILTRFEGGAATGGQRLDWQRDQGSSRGHRRDDGHRGREAAEESQHALVRAYTWLPGPQRPPRRKRRVPIQVVQNNLGHASIGRRRAI
jgi:hypothetical protein